MDINPLFICYTISLKEKTNMLSLIGNFLRLGVVLLVIVLLVVFVLPQERKLPTAHILQVPFTTQAPTNNWPGNQDCEEASLTMVNTYLNGQTHNVINAHDAIRAIAQLNNWEKVNFGYNLDTGAEDTKKLGEEAFGLKVKLVENFTELDLKRALAANHPVLLPHDARKLGSPKYANGETDYHMLVIRGYTENRFIVNDPGTSEGNGNEYTFETLYNAGVDWNHTTQSMEPDKKILMVITK